MAIKLVSWGALIVSTEVRMLAVFAFYRIIIQMAAEAIHSHILRRLGFHTVIIILFYHQYQYLCQIQPISSDYMFDGRPPFG